jgi:hypothetical protein
MGSSQYMDIQMNMPRLAPLTSETRSDRCVQRAYPYDSIIRREAGVGH